MADLASAGLELAGADTLVVDASKATPFADKDAYLAAIGQVRAAATAYFAGGDLLLDDASYDALIARVSATEAVQPGWQVQDSPTVAVAAGMAVIGEVHPQRADAEPGQCF